MSKQISAAELATIVTRLLTDTKATGELDGFECFQVFMTEIAKVVCDHCGGEVRQDASPFDDVWYIGIHGNDSLPDAFGGIWREFDPAGEMFDTDDGSFVVASQAIAMATTQPLAQMPPNPAKDGGETVQSPVWSEINYWEAAREGWILSNDEQPPRLTGGTDDFHSIVANGTAPHHVAAREYLKVHNPQVFEAVMKAQFLIRAGSDGDGAGHAELGERPLSLILNIPVTTHSSSTPEKVRGAIQRLIDMGRAVATAASNSGDGSLDMAPLATDLIIGAPTVAVTNLGRSGPVYADQEFKNFHRLLCERFGYVHDLVDWKRDQISLIEWIASKR